MRADDHQLTMLDALPWQQPSGGSRLAEWLMTLHSSTGNCLGLMFNWSGLGPPVAEREQLIELTLRE